MRLAVAIALAGGLWAVAGAPPGNTKKKPVSKKTAASRPGPAASKTASARKTASRKPPASKKKSTASRRKAGWRSGQMAPAPERYREIEEALVRKGFLDKAGTGTWGADSIEALKRFQSAQGLKADGRIDALSLIALGLGPRREGTAQARLKAASP